MCAVFQWGAASLPPHLRGIPHRLLATRFVAHCQGPSFDCDARAARPRTWPAGTPAATKRLFLNRRGQLFSRIKFNYEIHCPMVTVVGTGGFWKPGSLPKGVVFTKNQSCSLISALRNSIRRTSLSCIPVNIGNLRENFHDSKSILGTIRIKLLWPSPLTRLR